MFTPTAFTASGSKYEDLIVNLDLLSLRSIWSCLIAQQSCMSYFTGKKYFSDLTSRCPSPQACPLLTYASSKRHVCIFPLAKMAESLAYVTRSQAVMRRVTRRGLPTATLCETGQGLQLNRHPQRSKIGVDLGSHLCLTSIMNLRPPS